MQFVDEKGKVLGVMNIIDILVLFFTIVLISALLIYAYAPPIVHEHTNEVFQLYFPAIPYTAVQGALIPGNSLVAYQPGDEATITNVSYIVNQTIFRSSPYHLNLLGQDAATQAIMVDAIVTVNASLEIGTSGQFLFNGFEIAPGNTIEVDINNSHFYALIHRTNYTFYTEYKQILLLLDKNSSLPNSDDLLVDTDGNRIGTLLIQKREESSGNTEWYALVNVTTDVYDNQAFFDELPLLPSEKIVFFTNETRVSGIIVNVQ